MSEWLLALQLHETLRMALVDARSSIDAQVECRSLGRALTNELVVSVQDLLPTQRWSQITRWLSRRTWRFHRHSSDRGAGADLGPATQRSTAASAALR